MYAPVRALNEAILKRREIIVMPKIDWSGYTDDVRGVVIDANPPGQEYYRFYSAKDGHLIWDARFFNSDEEAVTAFWDKFNVDPYLARKFKNEGVEMRVWR